MVVLARCHEIHEIHDIYDISKIPGEIGLENSANDI